MSSTGGLIIIVGDCSFGSSFGKGYTVHKSLLVIFYTHRTSYNLLQVFGRVTNGRVLLWLDCLRGIGCFGCWSVEPSPRPSPINAPGNHHENSTDHRDAYHKA